MTRAGILLTYNRQTIYMTYRESWQEMDTGGGGSTDGKSDGGVLVSKRLKKKDLKWL